MKSLLSCSPFPAHIVDEQFHVRQLFADDVFQFRGRRRLRIERVGREPKI